ncbi:P-loop containing nucleoside triphosphate hydrolase protein [Tribonema minus]|uniref:P-loop containing nucleoside triphosphate hydrolase protein n=1 Tax=Tribonema minus TaxID=303371 RepID=A0A836CNA1_9STRA|nr:P-loop containing nucleoside triphosphate hydrolase protein [Tribonema minus]
MGVQYASKVVLMARDGTIAETGDPQVLMKDQRSRLARLVDKVGGGGDLQRQRSVSSITEDNGGLATKLIDAPPEKADAPAAPAAGKPKVLIAEEERARGAPGLEAYVYYCRACGGLVAFLVPYLVLHVSYNGLQFAQNLMLSRWVDALEGGRGDGGAMWSYVGVSLAVIVAIFARSLFQSLASLRASRVLHAAIASRVVRGPMGWFERTPQGRILNRFSSDMQEIDKEIDKDTMETYGTTIACFFSVASILVVIAYTAPWLIIALGPISALSWAVGRLYLNTSRELKRLDSVTKSPIYAHFTESVAGVSTIRAFAAQQRFLRESFRRVDACNRAHFNLWVSNRWFNIRVQLIGASVALLAGAFLVYWGKDHIAATTAGLALLYALNFTDALKYLVREHALLEMQMNSVERVIEFTQIPQEAPPVVEGRRPPPNWPQHGAIQFTDLTLQYPSATTPVIEGMTFNVEPRTRIGIVGRTGAGKSSLTAALFRLVEPKRGSIVIDGVDILTMGLEDLRSRLAIVPQDPVLFRGTIRSNLDPFDEHTDVDLWSALQRAHLARSVTYIDVDLWSALQRAHLARSVTSLDAVVEEGGSNLSMGQRQLMCMARALVRRASILVMDEATAAVDPETDILIQEVMRSELRDCTILCIAHRLHTIIFYDRILVLERGRVAEYAPPLALLRDPHSLFRALCEKSGALAELLAVAEDEELTRVSGNGGNGNGNGHHGAGAAAADGAH